MRESRSVRMRRSFWILAASGRADGGGGRRTVGGATAQAAAARTLLLLIRGDRLVQVFSLLPQLLRDEGGVRLAPEYTAARAHGARVAPARARERRGTPRHLDAGH